jgi:hypothetical protein
LNGFDMLIGQAAPPEQILKYMEEKVNALLKK